MKRFAYVGSFFIVLGIFLNFYDEKCMALEKEAYYNRINSSIDDMYNSIVLEVGEIRQDLIEMQEFFVIDALMIEDVYLSYYENLSCLNERFSKLDKYGKVLSKVCLEIGNVSNEQCAYYDVLIDQSYNNYCTLVDSVNAVIMEYNYRSGKNLELFEV